MQKFCRKLEHLTQISQSSKVIKDVQSGRSRILTTVFFVAPVEAVGQSVTLPATRYTLPISAHEIARNVALCGEVVARQQLAL